MVIPTALVTICGLFATRKDQTMYKAPPQNPARMFHGYMFSDMNVYITMKQAVPAHCIASFNFMLLPSNESRNRCSLSLRDLLLSTPTSRPWDLRSASLSRLH